MIRIRFNQIDLSRILFALAKVESMAMLQATDLPYHAAVDYSNLVIGNIHSQKFLHTWAPLNKRYQSWKKRRQFGKTSKHWVLFGDLVNKISPTKFGKGWLGGVMPGVMDSGNKSWFGDSPPKEIAWYGRMGEYGRRGQPARAVFGPTLDEYMSDNDGIDKRGKESLRKIGNNWA